MGRRGSDGRARTALLVSVLLVLALLGGAVAADRWGLDERYLGWSLRDRLGLAEGGSDGDPESRSDGTGRLGVPGLPAAPTPPDLAEPVAASEAGAPDVPAVRRALRGPLRDGDLGPHVVALVGGLDPETPEYAAGRGQVVPASTAKLLTAAAALEALGPDARFTTRVVRGEGPRELVLVGGGDPYLSRTPAEPGSLTYPPRADVTTLAVETAAALAAEAQPGRVRIGYDAGLFTGPADNPAWREDYVLNQVVAPISALALDGGRADDGWGRAEDPAADTAVAFADALREAGVRVAGQPRPVSPAEGRSQDGSGTGAELASVRSAPLDQVVEHSLAISDNEATEMLARHVGLEVSGEGSFEAGTAGVLEVLAGLGVDVEGERLLDGSGLSRENRLSAGTLLAVLRLAADDARPHLRPVVDGLPVAGFSGSLGSRFEAGDPEGLGMVRAKTGTLTGVHGLAGLVTDREGSVLPFVLVADRVPADKSLEARAALDRAAAALAACRCSTGTTDRDE